MNSKKCEHVLIYYDKIGKYGKIGFCIKSHDKIKINCYYSRQCYRDNNHCTCTHESIQDNHCEVCFCEIKECPVKDARHGSKHFMYKKGCCKKCGISVSSKCKKIASASCEKVKFDYYYVCDCGYIVPLTDMLGIKFCPQCGLEGYISSDKSKRYNPVPILQDLYAFNTYNKWMRGEMLKAGYAKAEQSNVTGEAKRTHEKISLNKTEVSPGDTYHIPIPSLTESQCIIPDTIHLSFDFVCDNTKSGFLNNLSKLLFQQFAIQVQGNIFYDNTGESLMEVYKDLWLSSETRENMVEYGIANENIRKILSKDDSAVTSNKADDVLLSGLFTRQKLKLGQILKNYGPFASYGMPTFEYRITLPKSEKIMKTQSGETLGNYKLKDIFLEYETIESENLVSQVRSEYAEVGCSLQYDYTTLLSTLNWKKDSTKENVVVNIPRSNMKAVVLLFKKMGAPADSEEFYNANVEKISVTIEGISTVYSKGLVKSELYNEAAWFFGTRDDFANDNVSCLDFYKSKYAVVIDLRAVDDDKVFKSGRKLLGTQSGILLEIDRKATTDDLHCHVFVIADGIIDLNTSQLTRIQY